MTVRARQNTLMFIAAFIVCGLLALAQRATDSTPVTPRVLAQPATDSTPVTPGGSLVLALRPPFEHNRDLAWRVDRMSPQDMKALLPYADDPTVEHGHSPVVIYEDDKPLGPAHSTFADISKLGHGRFTFWIGQGLIFSTSDGSDPNDNGRRYWAVVP